MKKTTVYVTQETDHDFSGAEAYGDIRFLTKDDFNNTRGSLVNEELVNRLRFLLRDIQPGDWVIPAGSPYVAAAVFMILGQRGIHQVNILRWDNRDRRYRPMYLDIRQLSAYSRQH